MTRVLFLFWLLSGFAAWAGSPPGDSGDAGHGAVSVAPAAFLPVGLPAIDSGEALDDDFRLDRPAIPIVAESCGPSLNSQVSGRRDRKATPLEALLTCGHLLI